MTKKSPASRSRRNASTIRWGYQGKSYTSTILPTPCPMCHAVAVVELPATIAAQQPDGTTHVCHPMARGCNHGFTLASPE